MQEKQDGLLQEEINLDDRRSIYEQPKTNKKELEENRKWIDANTFDTINVIKQKFKEAKLRDNLAEDYVNFINELDKLSEGIGKLNNKKIELSERDNLIVLYQNVVEKIEVLSKESGLTIEEDNLYSHVNTLTKYLSGDIKALIKMKEPQTIDEISKNGRHRVIDITSQQTQNLGGNLSEREVIVDGNEKKVFTKDEPFDAIKSFNKVQNKFTSEYPEYEKYFRMFEKKQKSFLNFYYPGEIPSDSDYGVTSNIFEQKVSKKALNTKDYDEIKKALDNDDIFQRVMYDYMYSLFKIHNQCEFSNIVETGPDEPAADRNTGMSVIAELLGMGNVICHSEKVTIKNGDKLIEGNLMDFSNGTDVNNVTKNDESAKYDNDEITITNEAKKQIADVQILDFICGNIDRHSGNLFLKYDTSDPNNVKLTGVEGIDNDCSFYTENLNYVNKNFRMNGLGNLQVVDKKTMEKISLITPAMLRISLQGLNINYLAKDRLIDRYSALRRALILKSKVVNKTEEINFKKNTGKLDDVEINIVNNWEKIDVTSMCKKTDKDSQNLFNQTYKAMSGINNFNLCELNERRKLFESRMEISKQRLISRKNIKERIKLIDDGTHFFRGSSGEYRDIQRTLKKVKQAEKELKFNSNSQKYNAYIEKLNLLKSKTEIYLNKKANQRNNGTVFGTYTQNRIDQVTALDSLINERITSYTNCKDNVKAKEDNITNHQQIYWGFQMACSDRALDKMNIEAAKINQEIMQKIKDESSKELHNQLRQELNKDTIKDLDKNNRKSEMIIKKDKNKEIEDIKIDNKSVK